MVLMTVKLITTERVEIYFNTNNWLLTIEKQNFEQPLF